MKKFILLLSFSIILIFSAGKSYADIQIDEINFPDDNFRSYIQDRDNDKNGILSDAEIATIWTMVINKREISSLKGIEHFYNLRQLACYDNEIKSLDLSNNTKLKELYCDRNELTELDVSKNTVLEKLSCTANKFGAYALDLKNNTALTHLHCYGAPPELSFLERNHKLITLDLSNNKALKTLECKNCGLVWLNIDNCSELESLDCTGNNIESLNIGGCPKLSSNDVKCNVYTKLVYQHVENPFLNGAVAIDHINFPDARFRKYIADKCDRYDNNNIVDYLYIKEIDVTGLNIADLKGIEFFVSLEVLSCESNHITELDLTKNTALKRLDCSGNNLSELCLIKNTDLEFLNCSYNRLAEINLIENKKIKTLYCRDNNLVDLDLSENKRIKTLYCASNKLESLIASTGVQSLDCVNNHLSKLDLTNCKSISFLDCRNNNLTELNLSKNYYISILGCSDNNLTELNLYNNQFLKRLDCSNNKLTTLSFYKPLIEVIDCSNNQLTTLDIAGCSYLELLYCYDNNIHRLNAYLCPLWYNDYLLHQKQGKGGYRRYCDHFTEVVFENPIPEITIKTLPNAIVGQPYTATLTASGDIPMTWSKTGSLPKGLELSESGVLSGIPERAKNYNIKVKAANSYGTDTKIFTLSVYEIPSIMTETLKEKIFGKNYSMSLKAKGTKPIIWSARGLPLGLDIDKNNGKISGRSIWHGIFNVKITAENFAGSVSKDFKLKINGIPPKFSGKLAKGNIYENYLSAFSIKKGTYPIKWTLEGNLPEGLNFSEGILSGTPTQIFNDYLTIKLSNDAGEFVKQMKLTVKGKKPKITTRNLESATVGEVYTANFEAEGSPVITWSAENLPENFTLNGNQLTGTPAEKGRIKFVIIASNPVKSVRKNFKINVKEADNSLINEVQNAAEKNTKEKFISLGIERNFNSLSKKHLQKLEGCEIAAVLPQISVDVSGLYDLEIELNENVETGKKLIYFAFPKNSEPSEDDEIIEFYNEDGEEISTVPENHKIIISAWFNEKIIYEPVIAVKEN